MEPNFTGKPLSGQFHGRNDIDQMPETPQRGSHHRRAQSETFFRFPDDILFDTDADFNLSIIDVPSISDESNSQVGGIPMAVDSSRSDESNGDNAIRTRPVGPGNHFRSFSMDADFFDGLGFGSGDGAGSGAGERFGEKATLARHRHSNSMDGSATTSFDEDLVMDGVKKAMAPDKLAELALIDPKRAKRILANRQSAARSKERKVRYTGELERKVQTLQTEATTLSAQVTLLQRDTSGLTTENKELKLRLQAMEQQAHLRDALNEALREEVQRLKIATGQIPTMNGNAFSRGLPPQFPSHPQPLHHYGNQAQQQLRMQQSNNTNHAQSQPNFSDFNRRI